MASYFASKALSPLPISFWITSDGNEEPVHGSLGELAILPFLY